MLSGEGGPIIQMGFDQIIFSDPGGITQWEIQDSLTNPLDPADVLANAILPRDVSLTDGGPPPAITNIPKTNRLGVTLSQVKPDSLIAAWASFGLLAPVGSFLATVALGIEDEAGAQALIGFGVQNLVASTAAASSNALGSILALGPNPTGIQQDITVYPTAFCIDQDVRVEPGFNQVAIMVAEIAKT